MPKRRKMVHDYEPYKALLGYSCANPNCDSGLNIHIHHIRPVSRLGEDKFWNIVCLCQKCHQNLGLHAADWQDKITEIYTWKCMYELRILGFVCDEEDEKHFEEFKKLARTISASQSY